MARKKKPLPILEQVEVLSAGKKGKAVAKVEGLVVFIQGAVPGDVCDVQLTKKRKGRAEARMERLITPSIHRVAPKCEHFGTCGGCKWQHLVYSEQLVQKRQQVIDSLTRIGQVEYDEVLPTIGSALTEFYRNKLEYTFGSNRWFTKEELQQLDEITDRRALGYHMAGSFEKILPINKCHLQPEPSNSIRLFVDDYARKHNLSFYNIREHHGFLRNLTIRTTTSGEFMILIAFAEPNTEAIEQMMAALGDAFPECSSLLYVINEKKNDTIYDQEIIAYKGEGYIVQSLNNGTRNLKFRIGAKSFFQTNPTQAEVLYSKAVELAEFSSADLVYDLYCGAGSISLFIADKVKHVFGIELVPEAIEDAKKNKRLNGVDNVEFAVGDMKDLFNQELINRVGKPDVVVLDPPRAGMHPKVIEELLALNAKKLVYISCDPATQARDLGLLKQAYNVGKVQPIDMFPHTHHIENVVRLDLK